MNENDILMKRIQWGKRYVSIKNSQGEDSTYIFRSTNLKEQNYINILYNNKLNECLDEEIPTREELLNEMIERKLWSWGDENKIKILEDNINKLKDEATDNIYFRDKYKENKRRLKKLKQNLNEILTNKNKLLQNSAESIAEDLQFNYMIFCCLLNIDESQYWKTEDDFNEYIDSIFINNTLHKYIESYQVDTKDYRKLARSNEWRHIWLLAKTIGDLFGCSCSSMTPEQQNLCYWSQVYDMAYESVDKPDSQVIENDDLFDEWLKEQNNKDNKTTSGDKYFNKPSTIKRNRKGKSVEIANEVFIPSDAEGAKKIYDKNAGYVRKRLQGEQKKLEGDHPVKEKDLRKHWIKQ